MSVDIALSTTRSFIGIKYSIFVTGTTTLSPEVVLEATRVWRASERNAVPSAWLVDRVTARERNSAVICETLTVSPHSGRNVADTFNFEADGYVASESCHAPTLSGNLVV